MLDGEFLTQTNFTIKWRFMWIWRWCQSPTGELFVDEIICDVWGWCHFNAVQRTDANVLNKNPMLALLLIGKLWDGIVIYFMNVPLDAQIQYIKGVEWSRATLWVCRIFVHVQNIFGYKTNLSVFKNKTSVNSATEKINKSHFMSLRLFVPYVYSHSC